MLLLFLLGFSCLENQEMAKEQQMLILAIHLLATINERSLPAEAFVVLTSLISKVISCFE